MNKPIAKPHCTFEQLCNHEMCVSKSGPTEQRQTVNNSTELSPRSDIMSVLENDHGISTLAIRTLSESDRANEDPGKEEPTGATHKKVPDGGWGWMVVLGSFLGHFFLEGLCRSMGIIYVAMLEKYGGTATATAMPTSLYNTIRMVLGPLASGFADRFSCRVALILGALLSCVAFVLSAHATNLLHINLAYGVLGGIAASFIFAPMYIIVGQYFDKKKGKAMSIGTVGCGVGAIAMAPLLAYLLEEYALYGTFVIMGALMLNCAVAGMLFRPLPNTSKEAIDGIIRRDQSPHSKKSREDVSIEDNKPRVQKLTASITACLVKFSMLKDLTFLLYCLNMMSVCFCVQSALTFLPALGLEKGFSHKQSAALLAIAGFTDIAGRFVNGILFDVKNVRYRRRPVHSCLGVLSGCAVLALGFAPSFYALIAVILFWGLVEGGFHGQRTTIISEIVCEDQQSSAVGVCIFFQGMGNLVAPVTGAMIHDAFDSYAICMYYYGLVVIISSGLFLLDFFWGKKRSSKTTETITVSV